MIVPLQKTTLLKTGLNNMVLKLPKDIYTLKNINCSRAEFAYCSLIEVSESDDYFYCSFSNCKFSVNQTLKEFENYLIALENVVC